MFDIDLRKVSAERHYPEIRSLFEQHSLLRFRDQQMDEAVHNDFASLFGPLEDRLTDAAGSRWKLSVIRPDVT